MSHAFYIYASWGVTALVVVLATVGILVESARLQRELKRLEAQGIRRRSDSPSSGEKH
jgi:heme exporter protein D